MLNMYITTVAGSSEARTVEVISKVVTFADAVLTEFQDF